MTIKKNDLSQMPKQQLGDLIEFLMINDKEDLAFMYLEHCSEEVLQRTIKDLAEAKAAGIF